MHDAGLLVPVHGAELEQPQRQLAVGPAARCVDQDVHRAVHRLGVVLRALQLHGRVHPLGVPLQVAGGLEQVRLGDVRGVNELVAGLLVPRARVVLQRLADDPALGVEDRQAAANLGREGEQVELGAELAVIPLLGFFEHPQVLILCVARRPGGAVDALQLRVLLVAAPVGAAGAHQLERRDLPGRRQVRAAAQVLPAQLQRGRLEVVVDGELRAADLDGLASVAGYAAARAVSRHAALEADQLQLVRLVRQLAARLVVADHAAAEELALLDDLPHLLLDLLQVLGGERLGHVEVVVEAVLDRRPDAELGLREQVLHRLRQHVRGRVPQDVEAIGRVDGDGLDPVPVGQRPGEVTQLPVDPRGDGLGCRGPGRPAPGRPSCPLPPRARFRRV